MALLGAGGAAARPGGVLLGMPELAAGGGVLLVAVAVGASRRGRDGLVACAGLLAPALLVLSGAPLAGVRAVSGAPLLALGLTGLAIVAVGLGRWPPRWVFLPAVFLLYVVFAGRVQL